jgi:MFS family permease
MSSRELRASLSLASIFGLRLFGMFIILPVFALWTMGRPGWDLQTAGIALGAYGLTQAVLQIPFGTLSDRFGRKPLMYLGLAILAAGSFVCAIAESPWLMILGRVIQGAGAISSVALAAAADLTSGAQRTKAMAAVRWVVPDAPALPRGPGTRTLGLREVLRDPELRRLNAGIFVLHAVLMAIFIVIPGALAVAIAGLGSLAGIVAALVIFFAGFNVLEAKLPALVSRAAPREPRGAATGLYSSVQVLGTFAGGALGGALAQHAGSIAVLAVCFAAMLAWLVVAWNMGDFVPAASGAARNG